MTEHITLFLLFAFALTKASALTYGACITSAVPLNERSECPPERRRSVQLSGEASVQLNKEHNDECPPK